VNQLVTNQQMLESEVVEGTLQGSIVKLPAGEVQFAVGADFRRDTYQHNPDQSYVHGEDWAIVAGAFEPIHAGISVHEVYGELLIPVVKDLPFLESVSVDLGVRNSDYATIGQLQTYKATGNWQVTDWLSFRGGYELAARAPNLGETNPQPGGPARNDWINGHRGRRSLRHYQFISHGAELVLRAGTLHREWSACQYHQSLSVW
jgi:iron complex outermembrane recepter protein